MPRNEELRRAEAQRETMKWAAMQARDKVRTKLMDVSRRIIDAELERIYGPTINHLWEQVNVAMVARIQAEEAAAIEGAGAPAPLGTIFQRWTTQRKYLGQDPAQVYRSVYGPRTWVLATPSESGVLEAVTQSSILPANQRRSRAPEVGEYIVRLHKKDGSTGLKYITAYNLRANGWFPKGENPNVTAPIEDEQR